MITKMFDTVMGPSVGPNIKLFQRFREYWGSVDQSSYKSGLDVEFIASTLKPVQDDIIRFIRQQLTEFRPRDDYRELLHLSLLFLGADCSTRSGSWGIPSSSMDVKADLQSEDIHLSFPVPTDCNANCLLSTTSTHL